jgi:hypothetical protein
VTPTDDFAAFHASVFARLVGQLTWGFGATLAGLEPATYGLEVRHGPSAWWCLGASPPVGSGLSSDQWRRGRSGDDDRIASGIAITACLEWSRWPWGYSGG